MSHVPTDVDDARRSVCDKWMEFTTDDAWASNEADDVSQHAGVCWRAETFFDGGCGGGRTNILLARVDGRGGSCPAAGDITAMAEEGCDTLILGRRDENAVIAVVNARMRRDSGGNG